MKSQFNRRDFLKLLSASPLLPLVNHLDPNDAQRQELSSDSQRPNIIILLLDTLSASHLSLYGYPRLTDRYLAQFARRATVYHAHYTAGNYTTPSTASLLTGAYPWTNRAFHINGIITKNVLPNNMFSQLQDAYYLMGFAQNTWADLILHQFHNYLDSQVDPGLFSLINNHYYNRIFPNDGVFARKTLDGFYLPASSLFIFPLDMLNITIRERIYNNKYAAIYAHGLPRMERTYFTLERVFDGIANMLAELPTPFLTYIHLFPPHEPYQPYKQFEKRFQNDWKPVKKDRHPLGGKLSYNQLVAFRAEYDRYIASVDLELDRFFSKIEESGLLDNSYVIFTSDHGQLFERGVHGHNTPLMFDPLIRVPLIISAPKQTERQDVYIPTNTVDILPSLLHIAGKPIPEWCEGQVLPGLGEGQAPDRSVYSVDAKKNPAHLPLQECTVALIKGQYKLVRYLGYSDYDDVYELYDLKNDPDELENLFLEQHPMAGELQAELSQKLDEVNRPF
ncbi:MAG: sulfatase-like hydrolase/transferase [Anaerolineales bacterium]|nr:sulfatase-like hydrolase/transferase [Anaerolineales bacterium]